MSFISMFRVIALSSSLFFGLVVLGLAAHWMQITTSLIRFPVVYDFEAVALVAGVLSALFLPLMLVVGQIRRGAFTSRVAVELVTLTVLWIIFLVAAALAAQWKDVLYPFGLILELLNKAGAENSSLSWAVHSSSGLPVMFLYTVTLLVFALVGQSRGNIVWTASVGEVDFLAKNLGNGFPQTGGAQPVYIPPASTYTPAPTQQYQMTQQYTGTPGHSGLPQV
ncbi:hypothetical protein C0995_008206 [Termitomyces sp. Mi166|nr:hypothetical protein C0995_008206 [Termitomyces sp. Mi166\